MSIRIHRASALALSVLLGGTIAAFGAEWSAGSTSDRPVAEIDGKAILMSELETAAAAQLQELDRQRHQALEAGLTQLVDARLLEMEAERREVSVAELLKTEVESKVEAVSEADIDAFYTQNQARIQRSKDDVAGQIRDLLTQQRSGPVRQDFVASLRQRYGVAIHLEPFRLEIDSSEAPFKGPRDAAVTVRIHSDFQCPYCAKLLPSMARLEETYSDRVRFAFHQLPLRNIHPQAQKAAEASLCAEAQDQFWPMHDAIFANAKEMTVADLKKRAQEIGLDTEAFDTCLDSGAKVDAVQRDVDAAASIGLGGTPAIYVNGRPVALLRGADPFDLVAKVIEDEMGRGAAR
ncbi:MAG: thioredoxin domain-containing protein [Acidobacteriota bacterium]